MLTKPDRVATVPEMSLKVVNSTYPGA